ncbi:MAG: ABC transporter permease, partial [Miltoncostaeaceae bacterium]
MREPVRGVGLVAARELRHHVRTRTFRAATLILVLGALAAVLVPAWLGGGDDGRDLRIGVPPPAAGLPAALEASGGEQQRGVSARVLAPGPAREALEDGDLDLALLDEGDRLALVGEAVPEPADLALVRSALQRAQVEQALRDAGADPSEVAGALAPVAVVPVALDGGGPGDDETFVAVLTSIALVLALVFAGMLVANGVAEEKTTRTSEVLMAALSPSQLLAGKVLGIGALALGQLATITAPAGAALLIAGTVDLPEAVPSALWSALLWFLLGYALYAVAFGALGALVSRQQEVATAVAPLSYLLWGGYFIAVFGVGAVDDPWFRVASLVPFLSPLLMPIRITLGTVGALEVAVAVALTAATAAALVAVGARVYRTGLVAGGPR